MAIKSPGIKLTTDSYVFNVHIIHSFYVRERLWLSERKRQITLTHCICVWCLIFTLTKYKLKEKRKMFARINNDWWTSKREWFWQTFLRWHCHSEIETYQIEFQNASIVTTLNRKTNLFVLIFSVFLQRRKLNCNLVVAYWAICSPWDWLCAPFSIKDVLLSKRAIQHRITWNNSNWYVNNQSAQLFLQLKAKQKWIWKERNFFTIICEQEVNLSFQFDWFSIYSWTIQCIICCHVCRYHCRKQFHV